METTCYPPLDCINAWWRPRDMRRLITWIFAVDHVTFNVRDLVRWRLSLEEERWPGRCTIHQESEVLTMSWQICSLKNDYLLKWVESPATKASWRFYAPATVYASFVQIVSCSFFFSEIFASSSKSYRDRLYASLYACETCCCFCFKSHFLPCLQAMTPTIYQAINLLRTSCCYSLHDTHFILSFSLTPTVKAIYRSSPWLIMLFALHTLLSHLQLLSLFILDVKNYRGGAWGEQKAEWTRNKLGISGALSSLTFQPHPSPQPPYLFVDTRGNV